MVDPTNSGIVALIAGLSILNSKDMGIIYDIDLWRLLYEMVFQKVPCTSEHISNLMGPPASIAIPETRDLVAITRAVKSQHQSMMGSFQPKREATKEALRLSGSLHYRALDELRSWQREKDDLNFSYNGPDVRQARVELDKVETKSRRLDSRISAKQDQCDLLQDLWDSAYTISLKLEVAIEKQLATIEHQLATANQKLREYAQ